MSSFSYFIMTICGSLILFDTSEPYYFTEFINFAKLPGWVKISHIDMMIYWKSCNFQKKCALRILKITSTYQCNLAWDRLFCEGQGGGGKYNRIPWVANKYLSIFEIQWVDYTSWCCDGCDKCTTPLPSGYGNNALRTSKIEMTIPPDTTAKQPY